jgi:4-hydroxybenzoate polyprenyltransferase
MQNVLYRKTRTVLEMIKFSHTVFAFPFALIGVLLVVLEEGSWPSPGQLGWICAALVGARSGAMAVNRLIDIHIDRANPRTADRHLPTGRVGLPEAWLLVVLSFALLVLAAWRLNPLCAWLSPLLIGLFVLYPFCKRFTSGSHLVLGLCLAAAPVGAWIALRGNLDWPPLVLGLAVLVWWPVSISCTLYRMRISTALSVSIRSRPVSGPTKPCQWPGCCIWRWCCCCCCSGSCPLLEKSIWQVCW